MDPIEVREFISEISKAYGIPREYLTGENMDNFIAKEPVANFGCLPLYPEDGELRYIEDEKVGVVFNEEKQMWLKVIYDRREQLVRDLCLLSEEELESVIKEVKETNARLAEELKKVKIELK